MTWASELTLAELAEGGRFTDGDWVESKDQDPSGSVRLTQLADVGVGDFRNRSNRWMRPSQARSLGCTFLHPNDILIARMPHPIGRACLAPATIGVAVTAVDVAVLRILRTDVDPRYVMWAINSPQFNASVVVRQSGTTRKRISRKNLAMLTVPIPKIEEQRRIVDRLEDHLSLLNAADQGLVESLGKLRGLRDQMILRALTAAHLSDRANPTLADVGTADKLPSLPVGWSWARLGDVAEVIGGITKDSSKQDDPSFVEVPYLRVANVQRGHLNLDTVSRIRVSPSKAEVLRLERGDVLLNEGGDRDKLARGWVWEGQINQCIHQNHVFRARVHEPRLNPYFLSWTANTLGGRWAEQNGKQSVNLASISLRKIKQMPVIVPAPGDAERVVTSLHDALESLDGLASSLRSARRHGAALHRSLLAAAFSGRLTGSASDLSVAEQMIDS